MCRDWWNYGQWGRSGCRNPSQHPADCPKALWQCECMLLSLFYTCTYLTIQQTADYSYPSLFTNSKTIIFLMQLLSKFIILVFFWLLLLLLLLLLFSSSSRTPLSWVGQSVRERQHGLSPPPTPQVIGHLSDLDVTEKLVWLYWNNLCYYSSCFTKYLYKGKYCCRYYSVSQDGIHFSFYLSISQS